MMDWKKIGKKLLFPHVIIIWVLTIISTVALVFVFTNELEAATLAYVSYGISDYTLIILLIYLSMVLPKQYRSIR